MLKSLLNNGPAISVCDSAFLRGPHHLCPGETPAQVCSIRGRGGRLGDELAKRKEERMAKRAEGRRLDYVPTEESDYLPDYEESESECEHSRDNSGSGKSLKLCCSPNSNLGTGGSRSLVRVSQSDADDSDRESSVVLSPYPGRELPSVIRSWSGLARHRKNTDGRVHPSPASTAQHGEPLQDAGLVG